MVSKELKNEFSWSKSRDETFFECARRYYYHYYGSWGGWERKAPPRTRRLYVLKQLKTRQMWAGGKVHDAIERLINETRDGLAVPTEDEVVQRAVQSMREEFKASRNRAYEQQPKRRTGLFEHAYNIDVPDHVWKQTADHVSACLGTFYGSDTFAAIRELPRADWLEVEELSSFPVGDIKVYVKLDFSCRQGDAVRILDWKTGRSDHADHTVQMACYALYAVNAWDVDPGRIEVVEFNLASNSLRPYKVTQEAIEETRDYIAASAGEMQIVLDDPDANTATEDNFALAEDEHTCRTCPFLEVCPKWKGGERER